MKVRIEIDVDDQEQARAIASALRSADLRVCLAAYGARRMPQRIVNYIHDRLVETAQEVDSLRRVWS